MVGPLACLAALEGWCRPASCNVQLRLLLLRLVRNVVLHVIHRRVLAGITNLLIPLLSVCPNVVSSLDTKNNGLFRKTMALRTGCLEVRFVTARAVIVAKTDVVRLGPVVLLPTSGRKLAPVNML